MKFKVRLTPAQLTALAAWAELDTDMADILIDPDDEGITDDSTIYVGQGDSRAYIDQHGIVTEVG